MVNKKGWIRVVEVFFAILLIGGALVIVIGTPFLGESKSTTEMESFQKSLVQEVRFNSSFREVILGESLPTEWADLNSDLKDFIEDETPVYFECEAKICALDSACLTTAEIEGDIYVKSAIISSNVESYSPRQFKLFCWEV